MPSGWVPDFWAKWVQTILVVAMLGAGDGMGPQMMGLQTDADIGKSRSTRSKTRQLEPPPAQPSIPQPKRPKNSETIKAPPKEVGEPSIREVAEEGTIISEPQEDIKTESVTKTTMQIHKSGNLAMDFLSTCKEGYIKHKGSQDLDRKSTRLNSSHLDLSRMPSSA